MKEVQYTAVSEYGDKFYYKDKELTIYHRTDGPAIIWLDGSKAWYVDGKCHRVGGPAIECSNGGKEWWLDGKRHRVDGPAYISFCGYTEWWVNGKILTEEEIKAKTQPKININGKDFTIEELNQLIGAAKGK